MNTHEQRHRGANLDDNTLFTAMAGEVYCWAAAMAAYVILPVFMGLIDKYMEPGKQLNSLVFCF
jgi:hypothetical protein